MPGKLFVNSNEEISSYRDSPVIGLQSLLSLLTSKSSISLTRGHAKGSALPFFHGVLMVTL